MRSSDGVFFCVEMGRECEVARRAEAVVVAWIFESEAVSRVRSFAGEVLGA